VLSGLVMLYLAAKPSHVGVMWIGLACRLHHPTACGWQTRVQSTLTDTVLLCLAAKLLQGCRLPRWSTHYYCQIRAHSLQMGDVLSNCSMWDGAGFRPLSTEGERPPRMFCFSVEGLSPRWIGLVRKRGPLPP
jgi:hypothetical protein